MTYDECSPIFQLIFIFPTCKTLSEATIQNKAVKKILKERVTY